jgi:hypothetical protein
MKGGNLRYAQGRPVFVLGDPHRLRCGGSLQKAHKTAYIGGAVTKNVVDESHKIWSKQLNETADKCEKESETKAQFDECLGPFVHNDDVVIALEVYTKVATLLFEVLSDPEATKERIESVKNQAKKAAADLLKLMPTTGGTEKLKSLIGE